VLREAVQSILPREILTRPKMGFPVPFAAWSRGAWAGAIRDVLLDRRSKERGIIAPAAVAALLDDHAAGRTNGGDALWSLLNLELWYRTFIDGDGVQDLTGARAAAPAARPEKARAIA
jgi:asparagine synthase (glutamine-hydrolysing)